MATASIKRTIKINDTKAIKSILDSVNKEGSSTKHFSTPKEVVLREVSQDEKARLCAFLSKFNCELNTDVEDFLKN